MGYLQLEIQELNVWQIQSLELRIQGPEAISLYIKNGTKKILLKQGLASLFAVLVVLKQVSEIRPSSRNFILLVLWVVSM
jgi:hypothetical protein